MIKKLIIFVLCALTLLLCACSAGSAEDTASTDWESVVENGGDSEVNLIMWGGNDLVNSYIDNFVAPNVMELYGITLNRVPMNAPDFVAKVFNEKRNDIDDGTIDVLWINAENFRTLKDIDALYGPFTDLLPNLANFYDAEHPALTVDSGIPIDGMEAIWGTAQLVFIHDTATLPQPPKSYAEILEYAKQNPGRITYPNPTEDFVGSGFVRNAYFELADFDPDKDYTEEEFLAMSQPVIDYFTELHPHLWQEGTAFPATVALQNQMLLNGEVDFSMGFEVFQTSGLVKQGEYPSTFATYVLDTKTLGNSHYLAIPYNAPNKNGALLVIDYLQSPEAQIEKMKPEVWGDMSVIDTTKLDEQQLAMVQQIESEPAIIPIAELNANKNEDMNAKYIEWIETIWSENIIG